MTCKWCGEPISQPQTGRPREFCTDAHRQRYAHRKVTMPESWDAPTEPIWQSLNQAEFEAEQRYYANHPERTPPAWLAEPF
jgi:hypothetical protein